MALAAGLAASAKEDRVFFAPVEHSAASNRRDLLRRVGRDYRKGGCYVNGTREVARRKRQITTGQLRVSA